MSNPRGSAMVELRIRLQSRKEIISLPVEVEWPELHAATRLRKLGLADATICAKTYR